MTSFGKCITMSEICKECGSKNVKKEGKPEFKWATFARNGVQPVWVQKLVCKDCRKIFGKVKKTGFEGSDIIMEIS